MGLINWKSVITELFMVGYDGVLSTNTRNVTYVQWQMA